MNIHENMDTNHEFIYDESVGILEQDFMIETRALILEMYRRFLVDDSKSEYLNEYDRKWFNTIEEEKRLKYDPNKIFENTKKEEEKVERGNIDVALVKVEESFLKKILNKILKILRK